MIYNMKPCQLEFLNSAKINDTENGILDYYCKYGHLILRLDIRGESDIDKLKEKIRDEVTNIILRDCPLKCSIFSDLDNQIQ